MNNNISALSNTLANDGVVLVKKLYSEDKIQELNLAIDENLRNPSAFGYEIKSEKGSFFTDFNNWRRLDPIRRLCEQQHIIDLILKITNTSNCWLFHDHVLVKSGYAPATPWHHDRPYYLVKGDFNLSVWTPVDAVEKDDGMVFLRGSHKSGNLYAPNSFRTGKALGSSVEFKVIDEDVLDRFEHLSFSLEKGDTLIFFNKTIHSANEHRKSFERKSLSVRYLLGEPRLTKRYINATPPFDRMGLVVEEDRLIPENFFPRLA
jgi:ectoine hydroxylase-related dioxygenase (phytanoyl-CoA dioxygenase family)